MGDVDDLPPVQHLIMEVLAARYRLGEPFWTFPSHLRHHLRALATAGLINHQSGVGPRTHRAWLTDAGKASVLLDDYVPPILQDDGGARPGTG